MTWRDAVLSALRRYCENHQTREVSRRDLIETEGEQMMSDARPRGRDPERMIDRALRQLCDEGLARFLGHGFRQLLGHGSSHVVGASRPLGGHESAVEAVGCHQ